MSDTHWEKIEAVYESALALEIEQRPAFIAKVCAGDETLRLEIESLLAARDDGQRYFETPVFDEAMKLLSVEPNESHAGRRIGNYEIIREIGRGGMGAVYLATRADDEYKKKVAIKLVRQDFDNQFIIARFLTERQILANLEHKNIARLLDGGTTENGVPYIVMEYIEGLPIDKYSDAHRLTTAERLKLFRLVCSAVHYAHLNLVIHRDIKPGNILVTEDGTPKLLDFGIAKLLDTQSTQRVTQTAMRVMTPDYASPEQVRGARISTASDVYSLGVLLYKLLTGHHPYRFKTPLPQEIERVICEIEPQKPSEIVSSEKREKGRKGEEEKNISSHKLSAPPFLDFSPSPLRGDLDNIILMAMRKEPERRYTSVEQFSEDLRRHLEGLPVIARTDTFGYRASKFILRHKAGVAAAALIFLSLIAGFITTLWQARAARAERDRATLALAKAERINNFMQTALGSPDPTQEGREVKVIEVLEKAARRAETELAEQPETLADVRRTIARTYFNLELYDKSESLFRLALKTFQETLGENHSTTANCMREFGELLAYREKFDEAIPLLEKTVEISNRLPSENRRYLALAKFALAQAYYFKGDSQAAEPLYREILDFARQYLSDKDPLVADASNELANILKESDYEGAVALYRQSIVIIRPLPEKRMDLATSLLNLGMVLITAGRFDEAEAPLGESLAIRREIFAENSPSTASPLVHLSRVHFYRGDYAQAEKEARQAVDIQEKTLPKGHRNLAPAHVALGRALIKNGKLKEAEKYLRAGLEVYLKRLGAENRNTATAESSLGECLTLQKRFAEAEILLKHSNEILQARLGDKDPLTIEANKQLTRLYEARGKRDK